MPINIKNKLSRREALKNVGLLLGISIPLAKWEVLSATVIDKDFTPQFFNSNEFLMISNMVDLIIPRTDSPGALDAKVNNYIDMMLSEWASRQTQKKFQLGIANLNQAAKKQFTLNFNDCSKQQKITFLTTLDDSSEKNVNEVIEFFHDFKWFVIAGYYTSEEGASIELNYDPMPGVYKGCLPYSKTDKAWSA